MRTADITPAKFFAGLLISTGIIVFLSGCQTYSNESLHRWAGRVVARAYPDQKLGVYDRCFKLAGGFYNTEANRYELPRTHIEGHSVDLQNACALILNGAEW